MSTALVKKASNDISGYSADQIQLIKNTVAVGATDDELSLFLTVCKNHKLDPFTRQVHFVKRRVKVGNNWEERGTFQIAIDGLRTIAERTGAYAGNDDPVFDDEAKPTKATVTVWKMVSGQRCPFTATARWAEYAPFNAEGKLTSPMWRKMPRLMLSKCAEALALRKAFPEAMSGLYTDDEMEQAGEEKIEAVEVEPKKPTGAEAATPEQMTMIRRYLKDLGKDEQAMWKHYGIADGKPTVAQANTIISQLGSAKYTKDKEEAAKVAEHNASIVEAESLPN